MFEKRITLTFDSEERILGWSPRGGRMPFGLRLYLSAMIRRYNAFRDNVRPGSVVEGIPDPEGGPLDV